MPRGKLKQGRGRREEKGIIRALIRFPLERMIGGSRPRALGRPRSIVEDKSKGRLLLKTTSSPNLRPIHAAAAEGHGGYGISHRPFSCLLSGEWESAGSCARQCRGLEERRRRGEGKGKGWSGAVRPLGVNSL